MARDAVTQRVELGDRGLVPGDDLAQLGQLAGRDGLAQLRDLGAGGLGGGDGLAQLGAQRVGVLLGDGLAQRVDHPGQRLMAGDGVAGGGLVARDSGLLARQRVADVVQRLGGPRPAHAARRSP